MPQLKIRGMKLESTLKISQGLIEELQSLLDCPKDYFTLELIDSIFISDCKTCSSYPFVEIAWFDRGQETRDKVAQIVTKHVQKSGYENVDVYFIALEKNSYYENGIHF